mmetsp:Transcript_10698/g.30087  ORF Transcript_10698/g.30087 Transcript_10698/m.30087 type:complete len:158 (+) Transcript_10698:77-550(+)
MFLSKKFIIVLFAAIAIATVGASDADADAQKEYNKMRKGNISRRIKKEKAAAMAVEEAAFNGVPFEVNFSEDPTGGTFNGNSGGINAGNAATIATGQDGNFVIAQNAAVGTEELNRAGQTCATTGCEEGFCCTVKLQNRHECIVTGSSIAATYCASD